MTLDTTAGTGRQRTGDDGGSEGEGVGGKCDAVYFIKAGPFLKVGRAMSPDVRRRELQTGCPFKMKVIGIVEGGHKEKWAHGHLDAHRLKGAEMSALREWFHWNEHTAAKVRAWVKTPGNLRKPGYKKAPTERRHVTREDIWRALERAPSLL